MYSQLLSWSPRGLKDARGSREGGCWLDAGAVRRTSSRISWRHEGTFYYARSSFCSVIRWLLAWLMVHSLPGVHPGHCRRYEDDSLTQDLSLYPLQRAFRLPRPFSPSPREPPLFLALLKWHSYPNLLRREIFNIFLIALRASIMPHAYLLRHFHFVCLSKSRLFTAIQSTFWQC